MRFFVFLSVLFYFVGAAFAENLNLPTAPQDSDYRHYPTEQVELGRLLFYDRVLSGTYRVSCATCHNHDRASSNGFRLDGKTAVEGDELAINGLPVYDALKPSSKHAPTLFNLGAKEFSKLFSDGRVSASKEGKFHSPAKQGLPKGLRDVLAVQTLFPAVTDDELVGIIDSDISSVAHRGNQAVWDALAKRIQRLPEYWPHFQKAFPELSGPEDISMVEIANAISAFVGNEWRSDHSPFDAYLRGDKAALTTVQKRGMEVFYGKGKCSACHNGPFQTDHRFHHISMPVWRFDNEFENGTGKINSGRIGVTGMLDDMFHFRTPSLRNVAVTGPYGQAGAFKSLEGAVRHHLDPINGYIKFLSDRPKLKMSRVALGNTFQFFDSLNDVPEVNLTDQEIMDLMAFLGALTDRVGLAGKMGKPEEVPSSLALD